MSIRKEFSGLRKLTEPGNLQRDARALWPSLPGRRDGVKDAKRGISAVERESKLDALRDLRLGEIRGKCSAVRAALCVAREQALKLASVIEQRLAVLPGDVKPLGSVGVFILGLIMLVFTEASLIRDVGNAWGIGASAHQWAIGLTLIVVPSFFLELLDSGRALRGSITGHRLFVPVGFGLTVAMVVAVSWFRFAHMEAVAPEISERLPTFFAAHGTKIEAVLILLNTMFAVTALTAFGEIEDSLRVNFLRWRLARANRRADDIDLDLAVLAELAKTAEARVGRLHDAVLASYRHGRLEGECGGGGGRLRAALAAIGVVVLLVVLTSCTALVSPEVAILLDVSQSVRATDNDLTTAALDIVGSLPRCGGVSVLPVNARAGSIISERIPCDAAPYDDDLPALYERVFEALKRSLPSWRAQGDGSDYYGSLRLSAQAVDSKKSRYLVVLGDMVDNRATGKRPVKPPNVPQVTLSLGGARVYLGFVESAVVDRLSDLDRSRFEENWKSLLTASGASAVEVRTFGLQGVSAWAHQTFGEPHPVYKKWRKKKELKQ